MAENQFVTVKCSNYCGFSVTGTQEFCEDMYEDHNHQKESHRSDSHWYEYVFSWYTPLILLVLAFVVAAALDPADFFKN